MIKQNQMERVETVLVVLSAKAIVYDMAVLRQKIRMAYLQSMVFFRTTSGAPIGPTPQQEQVDLLIDLTAPGSRQGVFLAKKFRRSARFAVGRNVGFFRKRIYDRVFDEKSHLKDLPQDSIDREAIVQAKILALAGIAMVPTSKTTEDRAHTIALELPPLSNA